MAAAQQVNEVEETVKRILNQKGVDRFFIYNDQSIVVRNHNMTMEQCTQLTANTRTLLQHTSAQVAELHPPPENGVELIRLKTKLHEIIIAPMNNLVMVVLQATSNKDAVVEEEEPAA